MATRGESGTGTGTAGAVAIVIGSMIGTGVFTTLGFQVAQIESGFAILLLWATGALVAFCGAVSYGEIAAALPRSGGEYTYLGRIYHPAVGFIAGGISIIAGFAAPLALASLAFGSYAAQVLPLPPLPLALLLLAVVTAVHSRSAGLGGAFQVLFTTGKIVLVLVFAVALLAAVPAAEAPGLAPQAGDLGRVASAPFAVSLIYVLYAYSGWNGAAYIAGEVARPRLRVPLAMLAGTLSVGLLYLLLNAAFLRAAPLTELAGKVEVGAIAADAVFGTGGRRLTGALIAFGLVSTASALAWAGPRVASTMGEDYPALAWLGRRGRRGAPVNAIGFQSLLALGLVLGSAYEPVLVFTGINLTVCSFLVVLGVFVLRAREPGLERPFRAVPYPAAPLLFLLVSGFALVWTAAERPASIAWTALIWVAGWMLHRHVARRGPVRR